MKQRRIFFILVFCGPLFLNAQEAVNAFRWSTKKLQWSDFQEDNSTNKYPGVLAKTFWKLDVGKIDTTNYSQNGGMKIRVVAYFIPSRSWVRRDIVGDTAVLAHEQLHFDIAEVWARRLRKQLSEQKVSFKNYEKSAGRIRKKIWAELKTTQAQYDKTHREKWQEWYDKVASWLAELDHYQSDEVLIPLEKP